MHIPTSLKSDAAAERNPSAAKTPSFSQHILPLFRTTDIQHMNAFGVRLADLNWMSKPANARNVLNHLRGTSEPQMPLGGPYWTQEQLHLFQQWMEAGYAP
jgi:hypothetical protein